MNLNSKFLPDCWWHIYILQVIHVVPSFYHYKLLIPLIVLVCLFCILHFAFFFVHLPYLHFALGILFCILHIYILQAMSRPLSHPILCI